MLKGGVKVTATGDDEGASGSGAVLPQPFAAALASASSPHRTPKRIYGGLELAGYPKALLKKVS